MARKKNSKGYCEIRCLATNELNLCDYFQGKRKRSKPSCRNCVHFNSDELSIPKKKDDEDGVSENEI